MNKRKNTYMAITIVFILDQLLKIIIVKKIHSKVTIIPNFFSIYYIKNTGAAFSILQNQQLFLIGISIVIILIIHNLLKKEELTNNKDIHYGMIIGGIYGNLLDRIIHKGVIDYLSFTFFGYEFPIFNLADSMIVIGLLLLVITEIKEEKRHKHE